PPGQPDNGRDYAGGYAAARLTRPTVLTAGPGPAAARQVLREPGLERPFLEAQIGAQQRRTTRCLVGEVGAVGLVVVGFVGEVLHVQLQADVFAQLVAGHGVVAHVGIDIHRVGHVAPHFIHVEGTGTDAQLAGDVIGGPQGEAVLRRVGQLIAVVGADRIGNDAAAAAIGTAIDLFAVQVAVTGEHLPFV